MQNANRRRDILLLLIVCIAAFWWRLGAIGLVDPDEPFYAQTAHEMVQTGDWITPRIYGEPQFEKPILYYWLVAASFRTLGESEFAGRAPTALFATLLVFLVYAFGARVLNRRAGLLSALVLATGLEFCVMSRLMLTDIPLAFFLAASIFSYWFALQPGAHRGRWIFLHIACGGLAVLTKGPIGSLFPLLAIVAFHRITKAPVPRARGGFLAGVLAYAVIVLPWYALMFAWHGRQFWDEFFIRDNWLRIFRAEHPANNHWYYYIGLLFLGSIPWMPAVAICAKRMRATFRADQRQLFIGCWLLTSLIFLTLVQSKLPSYAFFLFVPLALLVGSTVDSLLTEGFRTRAEKWIALSTATLQFAVTFGVPFLKATKLFATPALFMAVGLGVALVLLAMRRFTPWVVVTAATPLLLLGTALTVSLPIVDAELSVRSIAAQMLAQRRGDEPLLSGKFPVRGIIYYTKAPVTVLADKAQPFWAAHPIPVIVWKNDGVEKYFAQHPSAICVLRSNDIEALSKKFPFSKAPIIGTYGMNFLVRATTAEGEK